MIAMLNSAHGQEGLNGLVYMIYIVFGAAALIPFAITWIIGVIKFLEDFKPYTKVFQVLIGTSMLIPVAFGICMMVFWFFQNYTS